MRQRHKSITLRPFVGVSVLIVSLCATFILLYFLVPYYSSPKTVVEVPQIARESVASVIISPPRQLKIENINITTSVVPVGLTPEGDMAIDENPEQVAWYKLGPKPGEEGSAVVAGHYGWKNGVASIFNDLHTLKEGDKVSIISESNQVLTFAVTHMATYAPDQDATNVFKSDDGKAHLNLITCQGTWSAALSTYSERLVVFTNLLN